MNYDIKPIETEYKDHWFRSRLEARWAVFFDELGIKWAYEMEGFELDGARYLPDFWLAQNIWVEIKPVNVNPIDATPLLGKLVDGLNPGSMGIVVSGLPCQHYFFFTAGTNRWCPGLFVECPICSSLAFVIIPWGELENGDFLAAPLACLSDSCRFFGDRSETSVSIREGTGSIALENFRGDSTERLHKAISAARQARFEHGENGAPKNKK